MSSHPTTAMSSGTFKPYSALALKASTPMVSLSTLPRELPRFLPLTLTVS
jgi:hypothetical protein